MLNKYIYNQNNITIFIRRFQFAPDFVQLVSHKVSNTEASILDLACGTGDVSASLLSNSFKNITLADQSAQMLQVASAKVRALVPSYGYKFISSKTNFFFFVSTEVGLLLFKL